MTQPQTQTNKSNKKTEAQPPVTMTAPSVSTAMVPPPTQVEEIFDYSEDLGQGFENQDMSDRKLPIIELLQSNSPDVVESRGKIYAGQFRNTVTGEIYDEVFFVAGVTDKCWTEWVSRDDGGGFRGRHRHNAKVAEEAIARNDGRAIGKLKVPQAPDKNGKPQPDHELVESFEIYAILYSPKDGEILGFAMIPFTSTKIKVYRTWNSAVGHFAPTFYAVKDSSGQMQGQFPKIEMAEKKAAAIGGTVHPFKIPAGKMPIYSHRVKMTSESETKGTNTYMIPVLSPAEGGDDLKDSILPKNDPRYVAAKKLHDDVLAGLAKAAYETTKQEPGVDPEAGVPF
jgi:hypothetical protein